MMKRNAILLTTLLACFALARPEAARGQGMFKSRQPDSTVDAATRSQVIDALLKQLNDNYVFPETARKIEQAIRARAAEHEYDTVTSAKSFARLLTDHLQAVSHDKHLRVFFSAATLPPESKRTEPTPEERTKMRDFFSTMNFGFEKVERLDGNVGYLDLRAFAPPDMAGDTAAAAMNFLANSDALILDLRHNGGGDPAMVALVCSYLFPASSVVHLNDIYRRPDNSTHQWWTLSYVPGTRFADKPVYVLTSKRTFSAAEECTYNLKNLKRALIVGETTGGGAHPGGTRRIGDHFEVFVPSGRAISPITKTNWEGTGVAPDVAVPADLALKTAHLAALDKVAERRKGMPEQLEEIKDAKRKVQKELDELKNKQAGQASSAKR
jgi:chorismate mutase